MVLEIVSYPDPRLKERCVEVVEVTEELRRLAADMAETMYAAPGVGLAAPQVGRNIRLLVMDPTGPEERAGLRVLVNPKLTFLGERICSEGEGCLSVPLGYRADVRRWERVRLEATDLDGGVIDEELEGYAAIIAQHECDHLDGVLFIDHISRLRRTLYDTKVKKWRKRATTEDGRTTAD